MRRIVSNARGCPLLAMAPMFGGSPFRIAAGPFDQGYMRALFDYGYQQARNGYPWAKRPPF